MRGALEAELWASALLGVVWSHRFCSAPDDDAVLDSARVTSGHLVDQFARIGGVGARVALTLIERLDDGELGICAGQLARALAGPRQEMPAWLDAVGAAHIERAAVMREGVYDDGFTVFIEARHAGGGRHAVGAYIDNNVGIMARDIVLARSIEDVEATVRRQPQRRGHLSVEPLAADLAADQVRAAMALTDMTFDAPLGENYARLRALALLRTRRTPTRRAAAKRAGISRAERRWLRDEFVRSPEGIEVGADGDAALVASLAIDFCVDCVDGRPLRWSPRVVELFMLDWVPCMAAPGVAGAVPRVLDAWIRFVGRKVHMPQWAIQETRAAISGLRKVMIESPGELRTPGAAQQVLSAVRHGLTEPSAA